ncbi:hypothetical protein Pcinc_007531 [Petrolisthes cinctipes]|uniref:Uncharacterized protein n=1 Tax=Petrolisthes cinctipes TaxID=88211 RepID=A0AAE1G899_PETCI|nr:hypothetical protein Pcinc_007531 [Petrolisthes cinctipes]
MKHRRGGETLCVAQQTTPLPFLHTIYNSINYSADCGMCWEGDEPANQVARRHNTPLRPANERASPPLPTELCAPTSRSQSRFLH